MQETYASALSFSALIRLQRLHGRFFDALIFVKSLCAASKNLKLRATVYEEKSSSAMATTGRTRKSIGRETNSSGCGECELGEP